MSYGISYKNTYFIDKPNEDSIIFDDKHGIYILLDGVSVDRENGQYPNPSPALEVTKIFSEAIYSSLLNLTISNNYIADIKEAIINANKKVATYNLINKPPFDAGTVGIVSIIRDNYYYYSYIGDCIGRIVYEQYIDEFTHEQTHLVKVNKKNLTTREIRFDICNNINHPYGYGVFNGAQSAIAFTKFGKILLNNVKAIILHTDGYIPFIKKLSLDNIEGILTAAAPANLCQDKYDDRSIIIIKIDKI